MVKPLLSVTINTDDIIRELRGIGDAAQTVIAKGLNDSAFKLRQFWIRDMEVFLDKPLAFTKKVFVNKANKNNLTAITFLPRIQSEYLNNVVEGGLRRPGDYATLKDDVLVPVNARLNKAGNLPNGPRRWLSKIGQSKTGPLRNTFVGSPTPDGQGAVYQRMARGKLKLLAIFKSVVKQEQQLPLEKTADTFADTAETIMQQQLDKFLS